MARLRPLWLQLAELSRRLRTATALAVATDFDGTITPIVERPDQVELSVRARNALEQFARLPQTSLAVLSGRTLDDLQSKVGLGGAYLSGAAGLETLEPGGRRRVHMQPGLALPPELKPALEEWCRRFPGAWLEDKGHSLALHYRSVPARFQPAFGAGVRRRLAPHKTTATLVHGKRVFEVSPAVEWDKGTALERWLRHQQDALLFYFGDDTNDEPAFERVRARGGVTVVVGRLVSRAEFGVPQPEDVVWFLEWLAREWSDGHAEGTRALDASAQQSA